MISITDVSVPAEAEELVLSVLRSGHLAQGPRVAELERAVAELVGVEEAVAVSNGTVALIAALQALDVGPGDEVITSPFTFVATVNAVLAAGATVRFADIRRDDQLLDVEAIGPLLNERTKVLLPVHLYGQAVDMAPLMSIAASHGCRVLEDAAQAHGATCGDQRAGSFDVATFSFYATKNVTTGEGGMVTTSDGELADRVRLLRNQGMRERYRYEMVGYNYRLTDLQAAVGLPQIAHVDELAARRRANAEVLDDGLADLPGLHVPVQHEGRRHVFHQYTIRLDDEAPASRDELAAQLNARGIGTGVYYPRVVGDYDCFAGHPSVVPDPTPTAVEVAAQVLSLPVHPSLSPSDLQTIVEGVRAAWGRAV